MIEKQLTMSRYIINAHSRNQYECFNLVGKKGVGKTVTALKVAKDCYKFKYNLDETESYEQALKVFFYAKEDVIKYLRFHAKTDEQQMVMIWDDIRTQAPAYDYISDPLSTRLLNTCLDTARDSVAGFITTAPSTKGMLSFLRYASGYLVQVRKDRSAGWRMARGYMRYELPSGTMKINPRFVDSVYWKLPNWVYEIIREKRKHYKDIAANQIEKRMEERKKYG